MAMTRFNTNTMSTTSPHVIEAEIHDDDVAPGGDVTGDDDDEMETIDQVLREDSRCNEVIPDTHL